MRVGRVAMVVVDRLNRRTRALRPAFMNERWARTMERTKKMRRMTEEELAAWNASKVKKDISSTIEPKVRVEGLEANTEEIIDTELEVDSPEAVAGQDPLPEEPKPIPAATRNLFDEAPASPARRSRGRPRKSDTPTEE